MTLIVEGYFPELPNPNVCYNCFRCTSGCPSAFFIEEFRPHRFVAKFKWTELEEIISKEFIWDCSKCFKCIDLCPQEVSPAVVIEYLQILVAKRGKPIPKAYEEMIKNIIESGYAFPVQEVSDRDFETFTREDLGLGPLRKPSTITQLRKILVKLK